MGKKPRMPSEEMMRAVEHVSMSGTCRITCACGRTHYTSSGDVDFDEGELEELQRLTGEQPDKYHDHNDVAVTWGNVDGKEYVVDCKCGELSRYERFILANADVIVEYLKLKAAAVARNNEQVQALAASAQKSAESLRA